MSWRDQAAAHIRTAFRISSVSFVRAVFEGSVLGTSTFAGSLFGSGLLGSDLTMGDEVGGRAGVVGVMGRVEVVALVGTGVRTGS